MFSDSHVRSMYHYLVVNSSNNLAIKMPHDNELFLQHMMLSWLHHLNLTFTICFSAYLQISKEGNVIIHVCIRTDYIICVCVCV